MRLPGPEEVAMVTPSVTDWISAVSTAALGILGFVITWWQWRKSGFSPQLTSRIDASREAIELLLVNKGRASGIIDQVSVLRPISAAKADGKFDVFDEDAKFEGFTDGVFRPFALPAMASARIVIQAPEKQAFDADITVLVGVGRPKPREIVPAKIPAGLGIFGLRSVLPPGTVL
jgi:hypothetical protein